MIKNEDIFFNREKLEGMIRMIINEDINVLGEGVREEMRQLWGLKECKIVVNKYASRFDV